MRTASMMRFILFGAVGFGGGCICRHLHLNVPTVDWLVVGTSRRGRGRGASLGLASKERRRVVILAPLGALGLILGITAGLVVGSFFNYGWPTGAVVGAIVGASLGAAFRDWRAILALVVVGAVGCGVGYWLGHFVRAAIPILSQIREVGSITITGTIFGAVVGAAFAYLDWRKPVAERSPRVR